MKCNKCNNLIQYDEKQCSQCGEFNPYYNETESKQKDSKTSISALVKILIVVIIFGIAAISFMIQNPDIFKNFDDFSTSSAYEEDIVTTIEEKKSYEELNYIIPINTTYNKSHEKNSEYTRYYYLNYNQDFSSKIEITKDSYARTAEAALERNVYIRIFDIVSNIEKIYINDYEWTTINVQDDYTTTYYYATVKGRISYIVSFKINHQNQDDYETIYETLIQSLSFE